MLKPEIAKLLEQSESSYSLVVAVAKRSRDVAAQAEEAKEELYDKPINVAIDEFGSNKLKIVEFEPEEEFSIN